MKGRHEGIKKEDIDKRVNDRMDWLIEQIEEYIPPTLQQYENFLKNELEWVEEEKKRKIALATPLP